MTILVLLGDAHAKSSVKCWDTNTLVTNLSWKGAAVRGGRQSPGSRSSVSPTLEVLQLGLSCVICQKETIQNQTHSVILRVPRASLEQELHTTPHPREACSKMTALWLHY